MEKYLNTDKSNKKSLPKYIIKFNHLLKKSEADQWDSFVCSINRGGSCTVICLPAKVEFVTPMIRSTAYTNQRTKINPTIVQHTAQRLLDIAIF